jgi:hypothetical protein
MVETKGQQNFRPVQLDFGSLKSTLFGDMPVQFLAPLVHRHLTKTSEVWLAEVLTAQVENFCFIDPRTKRAIHYSRIAPLAHLAGALCLRHVGFISKLNPLQIVMMVGQACCSGTAIPLSCLKKDNAL